MYCRDISQIGVSKSFIIFYAHAYAYAYAGRKVFGMVWFERQLRWVAQLRWSPPRTATPIGCAVGTFINGTERQRRRRGGFRCVVINK